VLQLLMRKSEKLDFLLPLAINPKPTYTQREFVIDCILMF
jgi:hypothetical protein